MSVESAANHGEPSLTKSSETRNIFKELLQKENKSSLKPIKTEEEDKGAVSIQQKSSNTPSGSSAALVAQAVATKKRLSSLTSEEEMKLPHVQGNGELSSLHGATPGSNILAQLRQEKHVEMDHEEEKREERGLEEERAASSALRSRRRNKTVEKPVKSLGIASDPRTPPSHDHTPQLRIPMVSV